MITKLYIEQFRLFQDQEIHFGNVITAISGQNAVGKSTILGLVGNIVEDKSQNIFGRQYKTDFSEIFKASKEYDKSGTHKGVFYLKDNSEVKFRSTWQNKGTRFRIIPNRLNSDGKKVDSKFPLPVIYLGLSRLYPIGETQDQLNKEELNLNDEEKKWFINSYSKILAMSEAIQDVTNLKTKEVKSNFTGISTSTYDEFCNSAGQDNLGQILLSILSFQRLKATKKDWKGGLLVIDEMDATLHPVAQQKLIEFLFKEAKTLQVQVVFTTHSLNILEFISVKYELKEKFSNDYKVIFISKANEDLKIYHNPKYELIKNNLCLTLTEEIKHNKQLLVYSEDDETRWFFNKLIRGYSKKVKLIKANLGCGDLAKLLKEDPLYFQKVLFLVDGDVKKTNPKFIKNPNVLALPSDDRPEKILFDHLNGCKSFWTAALEVKGMTKQYFLTDQGPQSKKYETKTKEREKYSSWFFDQKPYIEKFKMFEHWMKCNKEVVSDFRKDFVKKYNKLALFHQLPPIDSTK